MLKYEGDLLCSCEQRVVECLRLIKTVRLPTFTLLSCEFADSLLILKRYVGNGGSLSGVRTPRVPEAHQFVTFRSQTTYPRRPRHSPPPRSLGTSPTSSSFLPLPPSPYLQPSNLVSVPTFRPEPPGLRRPSRQN